MSGQDEQYVHAEADLTSELGLARADVREVRSTQLEREIDWKHVRGAVRYTASGWAKLRSLLKISVGATPAAPDLAPKNSDELAPPVPAAAAPPAPTAGEVRELVMVRTWRNPRIVQARLGAVLVRVRVRDNAKLTVGMVMRCALVDADLWELAQPLPKRRGKW